MKFLIDVCAGLQVADFLRDRDIDVIEAFKIDPHLSDVNILRLAVAEKRVIITIDKDFGDLVFNQGYDHCGVIRLADDIPENKVAQIKILLENYASSLENNFVVSKGGKIRIRTTQ